MKQNSKIKNFGNKQLLHMSFKYRSQKLKPSNNTGIVHVSCNFILRGQKLPAHFPTF